jgi:hypothetical protein
VTAGSSGYASDWISILWPLIGGMGLALGLVYLLVWLRRRRNAIC